MRLRRSRIQKYFLKNKIVHKGTEGNVFETYGEPKIFSAEIWPAGGEVQAKTYGEKLSYIFNVRIKGSYITAPDYKNILHYIFPDGLDISEGDGVCLFVQGTAEPDYKIISIRPYRYLALEVEKL